MLIEYTPVPREFNDIKTVKLAKQWAVAAAPEPPLNRISSCTVLANVEIPEYRCEERPSLIADSSSIAARNVPTSDATGRAAVATTPGERPVASAAVKVNGSGALDPTLGWSNAYLQDNDCRILFDVDGNVLKPENSFFDIK